VYKQVDENRIAAIDPALKHGDAHGLYLLAKIEFGDPELTGGWTSCNPLRSSLRIFYSACPFPPIFRKNTEENYG